MERLRRVLAKERKHRAEARTPGWKLWANPKSWLLKRKLNSACHQVRH